MADCAVQHEFTCPDGEFVLLHRKGAKCESDQAKPG